jgi:hypothetical protein
VALPGLSGPPDWTAPGTTRDELNEPRWAGAPQTGFQSDLTGGEGLYRVMVDSGFTELSISFQAPTDPSAASNADVVYFGFTTDGTTGGLAKGVAISMQASGTNPIEIDPASPLVTGYSYNGSWSTAAQPWLVEPYAWLPNATTAPGTAWGINFKVNLASAGLDATTPFKILFAMHKRDEGDVTPPFDGVDIWTPDPGGAALHPGTLFIADPASWATTAAINAGCVDGVTIAGNQIGTRNVNASSAPTPSIINRSSGGVNYFFAAPTFPASVPMVAGIIEGKFHVANWGSIAASNAPWTALNASYIANGVPTPAPPPVAVPPAPGAGTIELQCPANTATQTCGVATPAVDHQCVYVELRAAPGQSVPFTKAAAYRNMTFQPLSDFSGPAEISVKGLKAIFNNDEARDVYLYVLTTNMAPHGNEPLWLATDAMAATRRFAEVPLPLVMPLRGALPRPQKRPRELSARDQPKLRELPLPNTGIRDLDLNAHQALSAVWPTYDVHVYYDTGKIIKIGKDDTKQLAPMYPFTYFYSHESKLYGFSHALEGAEGTVVKELRKGVYLIQVASEQSAKITTRATAHEEPKTKTPDEPEACPECPPPPPRRGMCDCAVPGSSSAQHAGWAALLAGAVALALRVRKRRRSS